MTQNKRFDFKRDGYDIDELLSCYLDGELPKHRHTEVRRLIEHDPEIAEKIARLRKQKLLLNDLPTVSAPVSVTNHINAVIESKIILHESTPLVGARQLFFRRVATAAIFLILFGSLTGLIYHIISPNPSIETAQEPRSVTPGIETVSVPDIKRLTAPAFTSTLEVTTAQPVEMNAFLEKELFKLNLPTSSVSSTDPAQRTYQITCDPDRMITLVSKLGTVWDKCKTTRFCIDGQDAFADTIVAGITSGQIVSILKKDKPGDRIETAKNFAAKNALAPDSPDKAVASATDKEAILPSTVKPEFTSPEKTPEPALQKNVQNITLTITITGI